MYNPSGNCLTNDDRTQQELIFFCKLPFTKNQKQNLIAPPPKKKKKKKIERMEDKSLRERFLPIS